MNPRQPASLSFSVRVALYFGALFLAAMGSLMLLWYFGAPWSGVPGAGDQRLLDATRQLEFYAGQQRAAIADGIAQRRGDVLVFAENRILGRQLGRRDAPANADIGRIFERLQRAYPDAYQGLRVIDPDSRLIRASSVPSELGTLFPDAGLVGRAAQPGMTELVEQVAAPQGGQTLAIVRQMYAPDDDGYPGNKLAAILIVYLDTTRLIDGGIRGDGDGNGAPGASLLFGPAGQLLARFPAGDGLDEVFRRDERVASGFEGSAPLTDASGREWLAVYRHLQLSGAQGWTLVHYQSKQEALAALNGNARTLIVAGLLLMLLALLLIGVAARRLTAPLQLLAAVARRFGAGELAARARSARGDSGEIVELADAFNGMAGSIGKAHAVLEARVLERTGELARQRDAAQCYLDIAGVMLMALDRDGRITMINRKGAAILGRSEEALLGLDWFAHFLPADTGAAVRQVFDALMRGDASAPAYYENRIVTGTGAELVMAWNNTVLRDAAGALVGTLSSGDDITERKRAERREQHHHTVLRMLAEKAPLDAVLDTIARDVEALNPTMLCSILLLDEDSGRLRHGAGPSLPAFYREAIDGLTIGPALGSCGSAAFSGQRVIVEDIASHPWWAPYRELARRAGLGACWSQPILSTQGRVLGTFALYHRGAREPSAAELHLIDDEARLAALAIEKAAAEARLQLAAGVFTHAREGIMITAADGTIVEVNDTFTRITGYPRSEALGQNPRLLQADRHAPEFYATMWRDLAANGYWDGEIWNRRKNGEVFAEMLTISAVRDEAGRTQHYVALFTDITPLKEHQRQLEHIAHYDALTGLPNRVLLADRLRQAIAHSARDGQSLAVVYLDLDGFKAVNDKYSHDVGDQLLMEVGRRMKEALRAVDTLARIGGDEFVAVLTELDESNHCEAALERLLRAAAAPVTVGEVLLQVSASIGVTLYPQDGADCDQLIRHADQAMYLAKQGGKNRYHVFDVAQDVAVKTQRESIEHIREALAARQFVLYYQPKVNMKSGAVIGAEALIRWQHPHSGLLAPAAFLPIIEDHPLSVELGEWVIDAALAQMAAWRAQGLDLPVSVNVGARQLQQSDFVARLAALLAAHPEVPPSSLELEILETSALDDMAQVSSLMHACHALGVRFALDDFGTGYSSLTYLKRLPVELLKMDQSFVRDMLDDPEDLAIIEGVLGLATAFRRQVIAEGVETVAHGELLLALGCELAQGYGIARPMPASQLPDWAASWRPDPAWRLWSTRAPGTDERALAFAEVELRTWLRAVEHYLAGAREVLPSLDEPDCRFMQWWCSEGSARHAAHTDVARVVALHQRVHALSRELIDAHMPGQPGGAGLASLRLLCGELTATLRGLLRSGM